jgi:L-asparagine transporter-like permease
VTALFATAGATNAGLFPAAGLTEELASNGQFPPLMGRRAGGRVPVGLLITSLTAILLAVLFDLNAIASIGSAIALAVFSLVTVGHLRVRSETGAKTWLLILAFLTALISLITFAVTTLPDEPLTAVAIVVIVLLGLALDFGWKRIRDARSLAG